MLKDSPAERFDVVVLSMGANDAAGLCAPLQWAQWQNCLAELIADSQRRRLHGQPASTTDAGMAADGMPPSSAAYSVRADGLSQHILAAQVTVKAHG